jgi:hypothetical protein
MEAIAVFSAATGLSLLALAAIAGSLCHTALRDGGDFEIEVRALSLAFHARASRSAGPLPSAAEQDERVGTSPAGDRTAGKKPRVVAKTANK